MQLNETYVLKKKDYTAKNGRQLQIVYIDQKESTDDTYVNRETFPKYNMVWLPNKLGKYVPHSWGWILYNGDQDGTIPYIKKFAEEVGAFETPPEEGGKSRDAEEVLADLDELKNIIMNAQGETSEVTNKSKELIEKIDSYKKKLIMSLNSEETQKQLQNLIKYKREMSKHVGHNLSFFNTILIFMTNPKARMVRSKSEWEKMGYTVNEGGLPIPLLRPTFKTIPYTREERAKIIKNYLLEKGVDTEEELTASQKYDLYNRKLKGKRVSGSQTKFVTYLAYDISDVTPGNNAETFPENTFEWYDKVSDENEKDKLLIDACVRFGESIGLTYEFVDADVLGGARGDASNVGHIRVIDDKRNHGLLNTAVHETAHQLMHWTVVQEKVPRLKKFYRGGSATRGRDRVEQEAELCAWFVLLQFGYEMQTNINYVASWGLTEKNASEVFDSIAEVADYIFNGINKFGEKNNVEYEEEING